MKIKEVIVVEGRDDITRVKEAVNADVFSTSGYGYSKKIEDLTRIYKTRGLIILTDPDGPGLRIREALISKFPEAKVVNIPKRYAINKGVGIENVPIDILKSAIQKINPTYIQTDDYYTPADMIRLGLSGTSGGGIRRKYISNKLGIPGTSVKHILEGLNTMGVKKEELETILEEIDV